MSESPETPGLDLTRAPRGELAAIKLVEAVAAIGDLSERHYLELKGPESLATTRDKQKVAKFILGAANRMPEKAAEAFEGCAVMVIGITKDGVVGIPPIEMLELNEVVERFTGIPAPKWDIVRVPVNGSTNQVLLIVVEPPQMGQEAFICRANGEGLMDGAIYIRSEGQTRQARSAELDQLKIRGTSVDELAPVDLEVEVVGKVVPVIVDDATTLDAFIAKNRARLLNAVPKPKPPVDLAGADSPSKSVMELAAEASAISDMISGLGVLDGISKQLFDEQPEPRLELAYIKEIDEWEEALREAWPDGVERFMRQVLTSSEVRVKNRTNTYLHDVEVTLHLEGAVEAIEYEYHDDDGVAYSDLKLPVPPRKWGPVKRNFGIPGLNGIATMATPHYPTSATSSFAPSSTTWKNTGSVTVSIGVGTLRPRATFESEDEESILVIRGEAPEFVKGTWEATVRGYNQVFEGEIRVEVAPPTYLTDLLREFLKLD